MKQIINSFNHITFKLFLCNAGTSKNNEEDLKTAKRLKTAPFKISDTKVCKIPIISYSHSCSHSSDKYIASNSYSHISDRVFWRPALAVSTLLVPPRLEPRRLRRPLLAAALPLLLRPLLLPLLSVKTSQAQARASSKIS